MILKDSIRKKWSKSKEFLLPLTGLSKDIRFDPRTYLFWNQHSIENYQLILTYNNDEGIEEYCRNVIFPVLDKKCLILESYNILDRLIIILDISIWAKDVESFLKGKYSMFSKDAKRMIEQFHSLGDRKVPEHIFGSLYPNQVAAAYGNKTAIDFVCNEFELDKQELLELGEIISIYDRIDETLLTDLDNLCHKVTK